MCANYQGSTHKDSDTSELVWRITNKACDLHLQDFVPDQDSIHCLIPDLCAVGRDKFESSSSAIFNQKIHEMIEGKDDEDEHKEMPLINFEVISHDNNEGIHELNDDVI